MCIRDSADPGLLGRWAIRTPDVLADRHTHWNSRHLPRAGGIGPGNEVTIFVEDAVVGQQNLVIDPANLPAFDYSSRVGHPAFCGVISLTTGRGGEVDKTDDRGGLA